MLNEKAWEGESKDSVLLLEEQVKDSGLSGWKGSGWYWTDETWANLYGPYGTKEEACAEQNKYASQLYRDIQNDQ